LREIDIVSFFEGKAKNAYKHLPYFFGAVISIIVHLHCL
jgi:hypothetical protein